jgi:hypothetical protein
MNADTIVDALRNAGVPTETPLTLNNPGGNNPWLFTLPASFASNGGQPVVLEVPNVIGEAINVPSSLAGIPDSNGLWYADGNMFIVRAIGRVAPNSFAKTLKLYLFAGNGLQTPNAGALQDNQIGFGTVTLPLQASNDAYSNWYLEAKCLWDLPSLTLNGVFSGQCGNNLFTATAFSIYNPSAYAAQQGAGSYAPLSFVVGANLNSTASTVADTVQLIEFVADKL